MGNSTQVDDPERWMSLSDAIEHFMESSSVLFPLDRNPFNGSPQDANDEKSASIVRSYALHECGRLIDRCYWGVLTNAAVVEPADDRDAIRHGLFDLNLGVLGRRHDLADSLSNIFTGIPVEARKAYLPADLERYRDCPVVLHAEAWRDVVCAWRADWIAERSLKINEPIDFSDVSDEWLGRKFSSWKRLGMKHGFQVVKKAVEKGERTLKPDAKHAVLNILRLRDARDDSGNPTLSENRFEEIWKFEARKPENRHLRMTSPGAPNKQPKRPKKDED